MKIPVLSALFKSPPEPEPEIDEPCTCCGRPYAPLELSFNFHGVVPTRTYPFCDSCLATALNMAIEGMTSRQQAAWVLKFRETWKKG